MRDLKNGLSALRAKFLWTNFRVIEGMDGKLHKTLFLAMIRSEE